MSTSKWGVFTLCLSSTITDKVTTLCIRKKKRLSSKSMKFFKKIIQMSLIINYTVML